MTTNNLVIRMAAKFTLCVAFVFCVSISHAQDTLTLPTWEDIFDSTGAKKDEVGASGALGSNGIADYVDLYNAVDAVFAGDNISNSAATDMSVSDETVDLASTMVRNDTVTSAHDLGNGFVMAKRGGNNDLMLYAGMERLVPSTGSSYVEFEFNQEIVQAISTGSALRGERTAGDLVVRVDLDRGMVTGAQAKRWTNAGQFAQVESVAIIPGVECSGDLLRFIVCDPWQASGQHNYQSSFDPWSEAWDMTGAAVSVPAPSAILEIAINVKAVLGSNPDYTSIVIRTPKDITLAGFRHMGHWAQSSSTSK